MNRADLSRAAVGAQTIAGVLVLFVALRLLGVGFAGLIETTRPELPVRAASSAPSVVPSVASSTAPVTSSKPRREQDLKRSISVPLIVTAGPQRAEVFVNNVKVGNAPFVGDVSCKSGETVRIDIMPPRGMPQSYERSCSPGTLRVE